MAKRNQHANSQEVFRRRLLLWYDAHARDLPWRRDRDPYRVWLSEVMLQQTRVGAVIGHYGRFLKRFPTIETLAAAREASVLAMWSGLGYYRRARMLHAAAKHIARERAGSFPRNSSELRLLPGIGRYTAAAIASIAFNEPVAVVDGNVERVLQRVAGKFLAGEPVWTMAQATLSRSRPGDSNQAMMELGATVCLPRQPKCSECPVATVCATGGELPRLEKATRQRKREICYLLESCQGSVRMVQRPREASLMAGMWELPEIPVQEDGKEAWLRFRHSITVTDYRVRVKQRRSDLSRPAPTALAQGSEAGRWIAKSRLPSLPLTGLARKILRRAELL